VSSTTASGFPPNFVRVKTSTVSWRLDIWTAILETRDVGLVPEVLRAHMDQVGLAAFGEGFATAAVIAAFVAVASLLTFMLCEAKIPLRHLFRCRSPCEAIDCVIRSNGLEFPIY
jgi:hypothetical protein